MAPTAAPVVIAEEEQGSRVAVTTAQGDPVRVRVWPEDEPEQVRELHPAPGVEAETREVDGLTRRRTQYELPRELPLGWYRLEAVTDSGEQSAVDVAVTPRRLSTTDRLRGRRRWGYMAQLYSVMSSRSWGVGDLSDLASLAAISGVQGADYVLINPLHAAEPEPPVEPSPYLPSSRRFFNPLYLRVADVAEFPYLRPADREVVDRLAAIQRKAVLDPSTIDRDAAYAAKLKALELLYTVRRSPYRQQQLEAFVAQAGQPLQDFALWCALREELGRTPRCGGTRRAPPCPPTRRKLAPGCVTASTSTCGCSGCWTSSSRPPSVRPTGRGWTSVWCTTSRWACTSTVRTRGPCRTPWRPG